MDDQTLRKLLTKLDLEIKNAQAVDETGAELLYNLREDIENLLAHSEEQFFKAPPSILNHLQTSIDHFEITHPTLTDQISRLLDILSSSGI